MTGASSRPRPISTPQRRALERIAERGGVVVPSEIRVHPATFRSLVDRGWVEVDDLKGVAITPWYLITYAGRRALLGLK